MNMAACFLKQLQKTLFAQVGHCLSVNIILVLIKYKVQTFSSISGEGRVLLIAYVCTYISIAVSILFHSYTLAGEKSNVTVLP